MIPESNNTLVGPRIRQETRNSRWSKALWVVLILFGGLFASTQMFACHFSYQPLLGWKFHDLYPPWMILVWLAKWHGALQLQTAFLRAGGVGVGCAGLGLIIYLAYATVHANTSKANEYIHGSARWAARKDIKEAGLLSDQGVYVGAWQDGKVLHYLRHNGPEHVLCYAPTRSGKGVGLVVPTLLSWPHSAVVTDLKGELWELTAGWRRRHAENKVLRFEPTAPKGSNGCVGWNPLEEIRMGTEYQVGDVQNLATLIVDPDGRGLVDHWQKTAQALLVGVILHMLYKNEREKEKAPASLHHLDRMLSDPEKGVTKLWEEMTEYPHRRNKETGREETDIVVASAARDMLDRPAEEAGSVLSTAKSFLSLYRDPVVAKNIETSEFKIRDLMHHENPVTLYIVTKPTDKTRLRPLVRVLVNMIVRLLADKINFKDGQPEPEYKHRLLMMLDEFPSLGKLEIMQESLAYLAGYGIKAYLICQDINQLQDPKTGYGKEEQISSNCHVQNAFPPNRVETADHISRLTGTTTIVKEQITTSGKRASAMLGQVSRTYQEVKRPLLTADEAMRMPGPKKDTQGRIMEAGDMVVYCAGFPAIYGKQPLYFQDPVFKERAAIRSPGETDKISEVDRQGRGAL